MTSVCDDPEVIKRKHYLGGTCSRSASRSDRTVGGRCTGCCSPQEKVDGECSSSKCDTDHQLLHEERECFCNKCPDGMRVRRDPTEIECESFLPQTVLWLESCQILIKKRAVLRQVRQLRTRLRGPQRRR